MDLPGIDLTHSSGAASAGVAHLDPERELIDGSIGLLSEAGLVAMVICDGSCQGVSGCSVAPLGTSHAVAA